MNPEERGGCSTEVPIQADEVNGRELFSRLYKATMNNEWDQVEIILKENENLHATKLNKSLNTLLHAAISIYHPKTDSSHEQRLKQIIQVMEDKGTLVSVLDTPNQRGDTPLHLAAAVGWLPIFNNVEKEDPSRLLHRRNKKGETPLFLAALHGNFRDFCRLLDRFGPDMQLFRRNNDGNTILHRAIFEENFELAYKIISDYSELVELRNSDGESPLHVLAKKPNVFTSSSHLGIYDSIIYYCAFVEKLSNGSVDSTPAKDPLKYPENYTTCVYIFLTIPGRIFKIFKKRPSRATDEENHYHKKHEPQTKGRSYYDLFPDNCVTCIDLFKFAMRVLLIILGVGFWRVHKIKEKKKRYVNGMEVLDKMLEHESDYEYDNNGQRPEIDPQKVSGKIKIPEAPPLFDSYGNYQETTATTTAPTSSTKPDDPAQSTPLLVAAGSGILEMVKKIRKKCPLSIQDLDSEEKNVVMLAAEYRHTAVFNYLISDEAKVPAYMFHQFDKDGNSILHLAAKLTELHPWRIPGAALQMQWETKWYKHVKRSLSTQSISQPNNHGETPGIVFTKTHKELRKAGNDWLIKASESCSVVAALIAAVAFATSSNVPGGLNQDNGKPVFQEKKAFDIFTVASLVAFCLSVTALVFFLAIITSRCEERDFKRNLPRKLLAGLSSLFASIAAVLLSFCSGHTFILRKELNFAVIPIYASITIPVAVAFFAIAQLPLYFDLLWAAFQKVPLRSHKVFYYSVRYRG